MLGELEKAVVVWNELYPDIQHVTVDRHAPDPFVTRKILGDGGSGEVYETNLGGIRVALKRIITDDVQKAVRNEVEIMRGLAKQRHHHIVQLIGSYQKRLSAQRYELGLLIWPVACCDLAALLLDVDSLGSWIVDTAGQTLMSSPEDEEEDVLCAIETLTKLDNSAAAPRDATDILRSTTACKQLYEMALHRIRTGIGCIAHAVKWLHDLKIQHKDLKPSQVLVGSEGLWIGDFGLSKNMSDLAYSTTAEGKTTTPKYLAPERAMKQPCGQPQDIFSLGCIFLEMGYQLARPHRVEMTKSMRAPWFRKDWCFSENIEQARTQATFLKTRGLRHLGTIIWNMLESDPRRRQPIDQVIASLVLDNETTSIGSCCAALVNLEINDAQKMNLIADNCSSINTVCRDGPSLDVTSLSPFQPMLLTPPDAKTRMALTGQEGESKRARFESFEDQQSSAPYLPAFTPCLMDSDAASLDYLRNSSSFAESFDHADYCWREENFGPVGSLNDLGSFDYDVGLGSTSELVHADNADHTGNYDIQHVTTHNLANLSSESRINNSWNWQWSNTDLLDVYEPTLQQSPHHTETTQVVDPVGYKFEPYYDPSALELDVTESGQAESNLGATGYSGPNVEQPPLQSTSHAGLNCGDCEKIFFGPYKMGSRSRHQRHVHTRQDETAYVCSICTKKYQRSDALQKHMRKMHSRNPT